jgi:hypothetical protein
MRKSILTIAGLVAALSGTAQAEETVLATGDIAIGNPLGAVVGGLSEINGVCTTDDSLNGVDGITFAVPEEVANTAATLVTTGDLAVDADVYWYDSNCDLIDDFTMAVTGEANEAGVVPAAASYGVVDLILGAQASVTLTAGL